MFGRKMEKPADEMKRLMRSIAGAALSGEREPVLCARAQRRMNRELESEHQISDRRATGYWHGEYEKIPSEHMDRARDLVCLLPVEEAIDAISKAEQHLLGQLEALRRQRSALAGNKGGNVRSLAGASAKTYAENQEISDHHNTAFRAGKLTSISLLRDA